MAGLCQKMNPPGILSILLIEGDASTYLYLGVQASGTAFGEASPSGHVALADNGNEDAGSSNVGVHPLQQNRFQSRLATLQLAPSSPQGIPATPASLPSAGEPPAASRPAAGEQEPP